MPVPTEFETVADKTEATSLAADSKLYAMVGGADRWISEANFFRQHTGNYSLKEFDNLADAVSEIGSAQATLEVQAMTTVSASLTIPANITLLFVGEGKISVASGQTLTINGPIEAPLRQIFTGAGSVAFGANIKTGYPEWGGAVGDGVTDDTAAIDKIQMAMSAGSALYFHAKTYLASSGLTLKRSDVTWRGAGKFLTTIKRTTGHLFVDSSAFPIENVAFEDVGFTTDNSANFPFNLAGYIRGIRWSRCRFWKFGQPGGVGYGILASATPNAVIEDSLFHNPGNSAGVAVLFQNGSNNIQVRRNRFLYCGAAFVAADTTPRMQDITFENNYSDEGFPYLVATASGSGPDVSYNATVLTHTGVSFGSLTAGNQVRALPVRVNGSGSGITYTRTSLTDTDAPFTDVREGDIVRTASAFAIVAAKRSNSILDLEEWLSDADRQAVAAPAANTPYTVYRLLLGHIVSNTGTTITVERWYDIDGNSVTPPAETLYEILYTRPSHAVTIEAGCRNVTISKNTIKRSGADQIIATASEQTIEGNHVSFGFDMGITLWGSRNKVRGNTIGHQGVGGIWTNGNENLIEDNQIFDSRWANSSTAALGGDITVQGGNRNRIQGNFCNRLTTVHAHFGILISADGTNADSNVVQGNTSINHVSDDILVFAAIAPDTASNTLVQANVAGVISQRSSATVTGTRFWNNKATTLNLSTGFFAGTYSNAHLRDNQAAVVVAAGTTVTGTDFSQVKVTNTDDGTNSEYFEAVYSGNVVILRSTATGTGTARNMKINAPDFAIQIAGVDAWGVFTDKMFYPGANNLYDLGSPSFQVKTGHFGTSVKTPKMNFTATVTPSGTGDSQGSTGDVRYDDDFIYVKTSAGWKRAALATF